MSDNTETLADGLKREVDRNQELLIAYKEIGPAGAFGYAMIKADISEALDAVLSGDVIRMLQVYKKLKGNK